MRMDRKRGNPRAACLRLCMTELMPSATALANGVLQVVEEAFAVFVLQGSAALPMGISFVASALLSRPTEISYPQAREV